MEQDGAGLIHNSISGFANPQAKVGVVIIHGKGLVEAPQLLKELFPDRQAGACDGGDITRQVGPIPIRRGISVTARMAAAISNSNRDSCMLQGSCRIQEPCPYNSYFRTLCLCRQLVKPGGEPRFDIIVQKHQNLSVRGLRTQIVHTGEMKGTLIADTLRFTRSEEHTSELQ